MSSQHLVLQLQPLYQHAGHDKYNFFYGIFFFVGLPCCLYEYGNWYVIAFQSLFLHTALLVVDYPLAILDRCQFSSLV